MRSAILSALTLGLATGSALAAVDANAAQASSASKPVAADKARLIVLTDIGTEPDDMQSMVRLLTYANVIDIEALIASTSRHMPDKVYRRLIEERVRAYGMALPNLRQHASGWPSEAELAAKIRASDPVSGMEGVGEGKDTEASDAIIAVVDAPDPRPVWVSIWGGAKDLAQALWKVRATRSAEDVAKFVAKLRVYSISDQDDAGPWARAHFPELFWIASIHGPTQYDLSTWVGISTPIEGANSEVVSRRWLTNNIRTHGPLGLTYPQVMYIMEGDTPSFLNLIPNGLSSPEHPNWGGWGGRYEQPAPQLGLWSDTMDSATGTDGKRHTDNKVSVWRWRPAFQNDFAARMDWSITPKYGDANHHPEIMLNGSAGHAPLHLRACAGQAVTLSAAKTRDPDGDALRYRWWQYAEPTGLYSPPMTISDADAETTEVVVPVWQQPSVTGLPDAMDFHIILEVTDDGAPALTSYRRAILSVQTSGAVAGRECPTIKMAHSEEEPEPVDFSAKIEPDNSDTKFDVQNSEIGTLLDNPQARAVLERFLPGLVDQMGATEVGQKMTLQGVQAFSPMITDEMLSRINAALAEIR